MDEAGTTSAIGTTTSGVGELYRRLEETGRTTFLELFFDVVFVFALRALSQLLLNKLTWSGAYQTLLLLLAIGWVWSLTARVTYRLDPRRTSVQLLVFATMVGALVLSTAAPEAYGKTGLVFAVAFLAINIGRNLFLSVMLRGQELQRVAARAVIWHAGAGVPEITGALGSGTTRTALWTVAVCIIYLGRWFNYPVLVKRLTGAELPPAAEYLAERHRALFVIGLGEVVLAIGSTLTVRGFATDQTVAFIVTFFITALIWRLYIFRAGEELGTAIQASAKPDTIGYLCSYAHLVMIVGIVVTSVGDELVIDHPFGHPGTNATLTILGGPALFLAGRTFLQYVVFSHVWGGRLIGLAALACLVAPMVFMPRLVTAIATGMVLTGVIFYDGRIQRQQHPPVSPPGPHEHNDK